MSFDRDSVSTAVPSYMYNMYRMSDTISTSNTIVHELETAGALSTVLKQVISKETVGDFSVQLSARVKEQGKMIEDICHRSYGPLRSALAATKRVSARAHELKTQVETHDKLRSSADKVEVALMNVLKIRRQQQNAVTVLEQLQLCLPALRSYLKLNQQMQECKYYPALKTLEQLEHTYLPRIDELRFAGCMKSKIPLLRDKIKQQSKAELTDFLAEKDVFDCALPKVSTGIDVTLAKDSTVTHLSVKRDTNVSGWSSQRESRAQSREPGDSRYQTIDTDPAIDLHLNTYSGPTDANPYLHDLVLYVKALDVKDDRATVESLEMISLVVYTGGNAVARMAARLPTTYYSMDKKMELFNLIMKLVKVDSRSPVMVKVEALKVLASLCFLVEPNCQMLLQFRGAVTICRLIRYSFSPDIIRWALYVLFVVMAECGAVVRVVRKQLSFGLLNYLQQEYILDPFTGRNMKNNLWCHWPWQDNYAHIVWMLAGFNYDNAESKFSPSGAKPKWAVEDYRLRVLDWSLTKSSSMKMTNIGTFCGIQ